MTDPGLRRFEKPSEWRRYAETAAIPHEAGAVSPPETDADRVRRAHEVSLRAIDGVLGTGITDDAAGAAMIDVYVRDEATIPRLPTELEGIRLHPRVTGIVRAL